MRLFQDKSIKSRLFILTISIFILSILTAGIYAAFSISNSTKDLSVETVKLMNHNYIEKIKAEIKNGINLTNFLSINEAVKLSKDSRLDVNKKDDFVLRFMEKNPKVTDLFISFDSYDNSFSEEFDFEFEPEEISRLAYHKSKDDIILKAFDERDYEVDILTVKNLKENGSVNISNPFWLKYTENEVFVITIAAPIVYNDLRLGVVGINYSLEDIADIFSYDKNTSETILVTENNNIIFVTEKPWLAGKNIIRYQGKENELYNEIKSNNDIFPEKRNITGNYNVFQLDNSNTKWEIITSVNQSFLISKFKSNIYISISLAALFMILGLLIILLFIRRSFRPLNNIISASEKISTGEPVFVEDIGQNNEFGKIISSINRISENFKRASDISSKIADGNFEDQLIPKSEKDVLSISINKIADNLKQSVEDREEQERKTFQQLWMRRGRFEVSEAERKSSNEISDLTFNIIRVVVNYTDAIMGGLYLYNSEKSSVQLISAYAYGNKKLVENEFRAGEGLVGACVIEKKKILLKKIPEDYIRISSGLGSGTPGFLAIIPVFFQERINSVVEIAFLSQPEDYVIEFIERLGDNIGAWIDASLINTRTKELLEKSRKQTNELAEKEEELNNKVLELEKIQKEIAVQNVEYESMLRAVNHSVMTVEYTNEGIVLNANDLYSKTMGFDLEDIKGNSVFELVKDQKENLEKIIEEVTKGNIVKKQVKRYTKSGIEKWLSATYTPYFNKEGDVERVLFFAFDVSDLVK